MTMVTITKDKYYNILYELYRIYTIYYRKIRDNSKNEQKKVQILNLV